uniref:Uncharacterized protein n=1 Tax=Strigamia maritima TaxID=126957 RepID=T1JN11_STRMM
MGESSRGGIRQSETMEQHQLRRREQEMGSVGSSCPSPSVAEDEEMQLAHPGFAPVSLYCMSQTTRPRTWCLAMITNPYPFQLPLPL